MFDDELVLFEVELVELEFEEAFDGCVSFELEALLLRASPLLEVSFVGEEVDVSLATKASSLSSAVLMSAPYSSTSNSKS